MNAGETRGPYVDIGEVKRKIESNEGDSAPLTIRMGWPRVRERVQNRSSRNLRGGWRII